MNVSDLSPFLAVTDLFLSLKGYKRCKTVESAHDTFTNIHKNVHEDGEERLKTFELERMNA